MVLSLAAWLLTDSGERSEFAYTKQGVAGALWDCRKEVLPTRRVFEERLAS